MRKLVRNAALCLSLSARPYKQRSTVRNHPNELTDLDIFLTNMSAFEELGVMPEIIQALEDMDWHLPTPIQTETIPLILGGGDVAAAAETGSGKTGAFGIPLLQTVYESRRTNLAPLPKSTSAHGKILLSAEDRGKQVAVDPASATAQCRHPKVWQGVRATSGVARGKWYFSARADDDGLLRVGWSSMYASLNLGTDSRGFGYGGTGMKSHAGKFDRYGAEYTVGDTVWAAVEHYFDGEKYGVRVRFGVNGEDKGEAFDVKVTKLGSENLVLLPTISMKNAQVTVSFSDRVPLLDKEGYHPIADATQDDGIPLADALKAAAGIRMDETADMHRTPLAIILEPSRELANQVEQELVKFGKYIGGDSVRHLLLVGGGSPKEEIRRLNDGVDIITGTLGTIKAHMQKKRLSLNAVRFLVLDEADAFATDNLRDVLEIHENIPKRNRVQTLLFSATLHSPEIKSLSEKVQSFPTWVDLKGKDAVPETVHHTLLRIDANADAALLKEYPSSFAWPLDSVHVKGAKNKDAADIRSLTIKKLKLAALKKVIDANNMHHAMIFVRTRLDADNLESFLIMASGVNSALVSKRRFRGGRESGPDLEYSCACLHSGRKQVERTAALEAFKAGEIRFLICTDVAARGIDVNGLPYLVNVTLPDKTENYIHRVGRVGRAKKFGLAISLVAAQKEAVWYHTCGKAKDGVCKNRKSTDAGGCVLWYNEGKLVTEIENVRLKGRIEELNENYRRNDGGKTILYGAKRGEAQFKEQTSANITAIKPTLKALVQLEHDVMQSYFKLQAMYSTSMQCRD